ncbi:MAG: hypothetical protein V4543_02130 [Bacteroidota bacterium]
MREKIQQEILFLAIKLANENPESAFLTGDKKQLMGEEEAEGVVALMAEAVSMFAEAVDSDPEQFSNLADLHILLKKAYIYYFNKSIEVTYLCATEQEKEIEFSFEDLEAGLGGDGTEPYIQAKVLPLIPNLGAVYNGLIRFVRNNGDYVKEGLSLPELSEAILLSAVYLGIDACAEMDFNSDAELKAILEA